MPRKYDLLILDYGGVYSFEYDPRSADKIIVKVFGKQANKTKRERLTRLSRLLGSDKIKVGTYVRKVAQLLTSPTPSTKVFEETTISYGFPPSPIMAEFVRRVRASGIKVSLLSDMYRF